MRFLRSFDDDTAESRYALEKADSYTPETLYELSCARYLLAQVRAILEAEYAKAGKRDLFAALQPCLRKESEAPGYDEIARSLGKTEAANKTAVLRLRQRFQQCLREQIAQAVPDAAEVEEELRHLRAVLAG